jgi:hypothetical protein
MEFHPAFAAEDTTALPAGKRNPRRFAGHDQRPNYRFTIALRCVIIVPDVEFVIKRNSAHPKSFSP